MSHILLMKDAFQDAFQNHYETQTRHYTFHSKLCAYCLLEILTRMVFTNIAYKDHVKNQLMKEIINKLITYFFVGVFGIAWYFTSRYQIKQDRYEIVIYDVLGKQIFIDGLRTSFSTYKVAINYISEYQNRFPHHDFSMLTNIPEVRRKPILGIFKKNQM